MLKGRYRIGDHIMHDPGTPLPEGCSTSAWGHLMLGIKAALFVAEPDSGWHFECHDFLWLQIAKFQVQPGLRN